MAEVVHALEFAVYLVGNYYISEAVCGLLYLPVTSGGNFSVPSSLQPSRRLTLCFDFVPPWQESPLYVNVLLA